MTETRMQLEDWLDDLCVRFIINLPEEDLSSVARICFQVEEAQWFYEDFIRPLDPTLPSMSLRSFCLRIFQHCPLLSEFSNDNHMRAFEEFLAYKTRVPVRGAIMLNHTMDSVVLVKGWKKGANWSFPRGKINKDEDDLDCAVREVYEETGYDIKAAGLVPQEQEIKYIEITMREQHMRLYVFRDVPMDTHFEPRTRKEISKIEWYRLSELPAFRKKGQQQVQDDTQAAVNANKFYMVAPFLVPLKKWVTQQKKKDAQRATSGQFLITPYVEDAITEEEAGIGTDKNSYATLSESDNKLVSNLGLDTLEGATAALHRLLKIQPPTQGLQPPTSAIQSLIKDNGEALLALLQGKTEDHGSTNTSLQLLHTPLENIVTSTSLPMTPQYHHPQQLPDQPIFAMPAPPHFSVEQDTGSYVTQPQQHSQKLIQQPVGHSDTHQSYISHLPLPQRPQVFAHRPDQNQQLQHPQPLPPQVQRAVFNGFQPQPPPVSQYVDQHSDTRLPQEITSAIQIPSFLNMRVPILSQSTNQDPPLLTSHSLALLNAFKTRDEITSKDKGASDLSLRRFAEVVEAPSILPEDLPSQKNPAEMSGDDLAPSSTQVPPGRSDHSDEHRSSLLNIFKGPSSKPPINAPPTVKQPIVNIHKSGKQFPASNSPAPSFETPDTQNMQPSSVKLYSRKSGSTFRPMSILARPQQNPTSGSPPAGMDTPKVRLSGKSHSSLLPKRGQTGAQQEHDPQANFQPQILRRPQPQQPQPIPSFPTELAAPTPPVLTGFPSPSPFGRQPNLPAEHKQTLLSLFGKAPVIASPPVFEAPVTAQAGTPLESNGASGWFRVENLGSTAGDTSVASRRGSQTPTSPANTAFLLGYLQGITKN